MARDPRRSVEPINLATNLVLSNRTAAEEDWLRWSWLRRPICRPVFYHEYNYPSITFPSFPVHPTPDASPGCLPWTEHHPTRPLTPKSVLTVMSSPTGATRPYSWTRLWRSAYGESWTFSFYPWSPCSISSLSWYVMRMYARFRAPN